MRFQGLFKEAKKQWGADLIPLGAKTEVIREVDDALFASDMLRKALGMRPHLRRRRADSPSSAPRWGCLSERSPALEAKRPEHSATGLVVGPRFSVMTHPREAKQDTWGAEVLHWMLSPSV